MAKDKTEKKADGLLIKVALIGVIAMVGYGVFQLVKLKFPDRFAPKQAQIATSLTSVTGEDPALGYLKAGESVERLFIRGRIITFYPDAKGMRFRLYDRNKRLIQVPDENGVLRDYTDRLRDWKDLDPTYLTFTSDRDKDWTIKEAR